MNNQAKKNIGILLVWTLLLSSVFWWFLDHQKEQFEIQSQSLERKVDILAKQVSIMPKIITLDLAEAAYQWAGRDDKLAIKAVETTINFYNEKGYLILDNTSVLGDSRKFKGNVPTPEKMQEMMAGAKGEN